MILFHVRWEPTVQGVVLSQSCVEENCDQAHLVLLDRDEQRRLWEVLKP